MPDRLAELRRQRALVQEHLEWLDREIAASDPSLAPGSLPPPLPRVRPIATMAPLATAAPAEAVMDEYRISPTTVKQDVRKGCFLYFALALVLLCFAVVALWFIFPH